MQGMSVIAGYEWAETVTDTFIGGSGGPLASAHTAWAAGRGGQPVAEIGDLCSPDRTDLAGHQIDQFWLKLSTGNLRMQQLWSNEAGLSTLQGRCVKGA